MDFIRVLLYNFMSVIETSMMFSPEFMRFLAKLSYFLLFSSSLKFVRNSPNSLTKVWTLGLFSSWKKVADEASEEEFKSPVVGAVEEDRGHGGCSKMFEQHTNLCRKFKIFHSIPYGWKISLGILVFSFKHASGATRVYILQIGRCRKESYYQNVITNMTSSDSG